MLNWPGAKTNSPEPAAGSASSVTTSWLSRRVRRTQNGVGAMGSAAGGSAAVCLAPGTVDIQQLHPRRAKSLPDDLREPLQELVAQPRVLLALHANTGAVERRRAHQLERPGVRLLAVRRHEPRPAEHVPRPKGRDRHAAASGR